MIPISWRAIYAEMPPAVGHYLIGTITIGLTLDGGIYTVLLNLYLLRLDYGPEFIGLLNSVGMAIFAGLSLPIGSIKRYSSRQLLLFGLVLLLIGMVALPLAQWGPSSIEAHWLIISRTVSYIGLAFFFVHSPPLIVRITRGDQSGVWRGRTFSWQVATLALAGFVGGILGGVLPGLFASYLGQTLEDPAPYQYPLLFAAIIVLPSIIAIWRIDDYPASEHRTSQQSESSSPPPITVIHKLGGLVMLLLVVRFLQMSGVGAVMTFMNVYLDDGLGVSTSLIGIITAVGRLAGIPVALLVPALMLRWSNYRLLIISLVLLVITIIPMALVPTWQVAGLAYVLLGSVSSVRYLAFLTFTMSLVREERQAIMSGTGEMAIGLSFAFISFLGGYLIVWFDYSTLFLTAATISLAGTVLFWWAFHPGRNNAVKARLSQQN